MNKTPNLFLGTLRLTYEQVGVYDNVNITTVEGIRPNPKQQ